MDNDKPITCYQAIKRLSSIVPNPEVRNTLEGLVIVSATIKLEQPINTRRRIDPEYMRAVVDSITERLGSVQDQDSAKLAVSEENEFLRMYSCKGVSLRPREGYDDILKRSLQFLRSAGNSIYETASSLGSGVEQVFPKVYALNGLQPDKLNGRAVSRAVRQEYLALCRQLQRHI